jgi:hypothetical protein
MKTKKTPKKIKMPKNVQPDWMKPKKVKKVK